MVQGIDSNTDEKIETIESAVIKDKGDYGVLIKGQNTKLPTRPSFLIYWVKKFPYATCPFHVKPWWNTKRLKVWILFAFA
jgi:hypothetical protein